MNTSRARSILLAGVIVVSVAAVAVMRHPSQPASTERDERTTTTQPAGLPRMLDLGADKCVPCKQMAPILVELKQEYAGRAVIEFIDVWQNPDAGKAHAIRMIPTQIFFDREGKEVWRHEGFLPKSDIIAKLKELGAG